MSFLLAIDWLSINTAFVPSFITGMYRILLCVLVFSIIFAQYMTEEKKESNQEEFACNLNRMLMNISQRI